jgi:hypothetical protein
VDKRVAEQLSITGQLTSLRNDVMFRISRRAIQLGVVSIATYDRPFTEKVTLQALEELHIDAIERFLPTVQQLAKCPNDPDVRRLGVSDDSRRIDRLCVHIAECREAILDAAEVFASPPLKEMVSAAARNCRRPSGHESRAHQRSGCLFNSI